MGRRGLLITLFVLACVALPIGLVWYFTHGDDGGKRAGPPGGIYSYTVPSGFNFEDFNPRYYSGPPPGPDTTEINAIGDSDSIVVDVEHGFPAGRSARALANDRLAAEEADARSQGYRVAAAHRSSIAGFPAVAYDLLGLRFHHHSSSSFGVWDEHRVWIADGADRVSVTCRWEADADHGGRSAAAATRCSGPSGSGAGRLPRQMPQGGWR